jgi:uncharacterized protein (DUF2062 family)
VQNTNFTSRRNETKRSRPSFGRSIQIGTGRTLLSLGSHIQAAGAALIFKAEAGEPTRIRPVLAFAAAVAVIVAMVLVANASVEFGNASRPTIQRATAW